MMEIKKFVEAVQDLKMATSRRGNSIHTKVERSSLLSEAYGKLVEDLVEINLNPNDPTGAGDLIDLFDLELGNLIEEYRAIVKLGLQEKIREEAPVRKVTVDVKAFSEIMSRASEEIEEKSHKIIIKRTKEGYLKGIKFANRSMKPYKLRLDFKLPYDKEVIEALQSRNIGNFKGLLDEQTKQIMRIVSDGALNQETVRDITVKIDQSIDGIGRVRASTIARTELMKGVNEGVRRRFEAAGFTRLKRHENFDSRICMDWDFNGVMIAGHLWKGCVSIAGKVFSLTDAALIDLNHHPNGRGSWSPWIEGVSPPAPAAEDGP